MLIGTVNGGVWRTTNALAASPAWAPVTDFLPSLSIGALTYDKANANTVYAGIGRYSALSSTGGARAGLFTSADSGLTWGAVAGNSAFTAGGVNISSVAANGQTILVSADTSDTSSYAYRGLFRSTDGGATFTHLSSAAGATNLAATMVVADPTNPNRYYMAAYNANTVTDRGVYRSDDAGATWTHMHDATMDALIGASTGNMKLSVNNNGALFIGIANSGRLAGVFRTQDQGTSFTSFGVPTTIDGPVGNTITNGIHPGGQAGIHFSLLADPTNDNVVYIGGDRQPLGTEINGVSSLGAANYTGRLFRSGGAGSWTAITDNQTAGYSGPHADSRAMAFDSNGNLIEADDGGLYRRSSPLDSTGNWTALGGNGATGLQVTEIHSVAYDNHGGVLIAGTQDTGSMQQSAHNSKTWAELNQGDGGVVAVYDRPGGNSYRYSSSQNLGSFARRTYDSSGTKVGGTYYPGLVVSNSGGLSITKFEPEAFQEDETAKASVPDAPTEPGVPFYTKFAINKVDAGRLLFGTKSLYETANHGDTLEVLGGITVSNTPAVRFSATVNALAYGGFEGEIGYADVLYSGAGAELRIRQAGAGFNVLPDVNAAYNAAAGSSGFSITDLVLDYTTWDTAFVGNSSRRVFYTLDAGSSWAEIPGLSGLIGGELNTLEYIERGSFEAVFAGGRNGVFWALGTNDVFGTWSEFGAASLPNARVTDLDYDVTADVLAVGVQGRGAWTIDAASQFLPIPEVGTVGVLAVGGLLLHALRRRSALRGSA
jgi:hypothetical protein